MQHLLLLFSFLKDECRGGTEGEEREGELDG